VGGLAIGVGLLCFEWFMGCVGLICFVSGWELAPGSVVYRFVLLRMIVFLIHWVLDSFLMYLTGIWASGTFPVFTLGTYWRCSECGEGEFNFNSC
jgi:hypothetical protein